MFKDRWCLWEPPSYPKGVSRLSIVVLTGSLTWEGGDKKKRKWRGGGAIIRGRRLFLIFRSKGPEYSREAINRGTAIIRGSTVFIDCCSTSMNYATWPISTPVQIQYTFASSVWNFWLQIVDAKGNCKLRCGQENTTWTPLWTASMDPLFLLPPKIL